MNSKEGYIFNLINMAKFSNSKSQFRFNLPKEIIGFLTLLFMVGVYWLYQNIVWLIVFIIGCTIIIIWFTSVYYSKLFKLLSVVLIIFLATFEFMLISDYTYYNSALKNGIIAWWKELFIWYINLMNPRRFLKKEIIHEFRSEKLDNRAQIQSWSFLIH